MMMRLIVNSIGIIEPKYRAIYNQYYLHDIKKKPNPIYHYNPNIENYACEKFSRTQMIHWVSVAGGRTDPQY